MFSFGGNSNKVAQVQLDKATEQILQLETQKKRLEMDMTSINLELENSRKRNQMTLEEATHKVKLQLESEKAVFERERKIWDKEKTELLEKSKREREEFEERLKKDFEIKLQEAVTLTKLEMQQKVAQTSVDKEREICKLQTEHAKAVSEMQQSESLKFYDKLTNAFQEMQLNGDKNSKFVQELALKLIDKTPSSKTSVDVNVDSVRQLEAPKNV